MRFVVLLLAAAVSAFSQSHPSWWSWASPDATALVGVRWEALRNSPFSAALAEELGPGGELGMPGLECLKESKQILLSSPAFLVIATGDFPDAELRAQAASQSMKPVTYKGVEMWISPGKSTLSMARIGNQILLFGMRRSLEAAIDNNQAEGDRRYSPLLKRAARFSSQDMWVVTTQLPDTLADYFVPLDVEARGFEGALTLSDGIRLEATLAAESPEDAAVLAGKLRRMTPDLPPIARGLQAVQAGDMVVLAMAVSREQVAANLRAVDAQAPKVPASAVAEVHPEPKPVAPPPAPPVTTPAATASTLNAAPLAPAQPAAPPAPAPAPRPAPRVIRILGLDDGPREVVLPAAQ